MKNSIKFILSLLVVVICLTSCEDIFIPTPTQQLEGDWKVVSFLEESAIITDYGYTYNGMVEQIPNVFTKFTLEFSKYEDNSANFEWVHTPTSGTVERLEGDISNTVQDELDFDFDINSSGYTKVEFTFYVNGNELILTGDLKGKSVIIIAEKD